MRTLYTATTRDEYELPIAVADTPRELARKVGTSRQTVLSVITHAKEHKWHCSYHKIVYTDKEWDE